MTTQKYTCVYTGNEHFFVDHVVCGEKILPGVAYLEMACAAAQQVTGKKVVQLKDIVWQSPVRVQSNPERIHLSIFEKDNALGFEVTSGSEKQPQIHCHGTVLTNPPTPSYFEEIGSIRARLSNTIGKEACYDRFSEIGLQYGPSFKGIGTLYYNTEEALSKIELPRDQRYILIPGVLDSALQTCIALRFDQPNHPFTLPFSVQEVNIYGQLPSTCWCYARKCTHENGSSISSYDIKILSDEGEVIIEFKKFITLPTSRTPKEREVESSRYSEDHDLTKGLLYLPGWDRLEEVQVNSLLHKKGKHIIIAHNTSAPVVGVILTAMIEGNVAAEVAAEVPKSLEGVSDVFLLDGLVESDEDETLEEAIERREISVFTALKNLLKKAGDQQMNVTVFTCNTQEVIATDRISCRGAGIIGLVGSFAKEHNNWNIQVIDLAARNLAKSDVEKLLSTRTNENQSIPLAYRNGLFYKRSLSPIMLPKDNPSRFRAEGCYVILGGAGGLGYVTSEYLVRKYGASVIWLGRRKQDAAVTLLQDNIEKLGKRPIYIQCDANNKADLEKAYAVIKSTNRRIDGLFHSAIVLSDNLVENMNEDEFRKSFDVKSLAIHNLIDVFKNELLDFVCIYSSLQSQWNAPVQANYAAGCTFIDSYANALNNSLSAPAFVINWGYWGSVGIVSSDEYRARIEQSGVGSINASTGMRLLEIILSNSQKQVAAIKFVGKAIQAMPPFRDDRQMLGVKSSTKLIAATLSPPLYQGSLIADKTLSHICHSQLLKILIDLGLENVKSASLPVDTLRKSLSIDASYERLLAEMIRICVNCGSVVVKGERFIVPDAVKNGIETFNFRNKLELLSRNHPEYRAQANLLNVCLSSFVQIITGHVNATDVIFPGGSLGHVESIYKNNYQADYFNNLVAALIVQTVETCVHHLKDNEKIKILEVGAGTGGTSEIIFKTLAPFKNHLKYFYTDVSKSFLFHAEQYKTIAPYLETQVFNIELPSDTQGFEIGTFDIVVGANVVHSTKNIAETLQNIKPLLKKSGLIILNELADNNIFTTLTFGLLDGWWRYNDGYLRLPGSPGLAKEGWKHVLAETGFQDVISLPEEQSLPQQVIYAKSDGIVNVAKSVVTTNTQLSSAANDRVLPTIITASPSQNTPANTSVQEIITGFVGQILKMPNHQIDRDRPMSDYGVDSILGLRLVKELNKHLDIKLATTILFDHPTVNKLSRFLESEYGQQFIERINREQSPIDIHKSEIPLGASKDWNDAIEDRPKQGEARRIRLLAPGDVDDMVMEEFTLRPPGEDEVQVAIQSFALNFGDLLCVQGLYPNMPPYPFTPGFEAAGVIEAVGPKVTAFHIGQEVLVLGNQALSLQATHVTVPQDRLFKRPTTLSASEACCMPVVSITMLESFRRADVRQNDSILIQNATGGIGLIAIQLANSKGARIIATAGSEEKLQYLRSLGLHDLINYREQDVEKEVMRLTNGAGVSVVINTLSGEHIQKGINCLGKRGRYVELSMTALKSARAIDLSKFCNNQTFIGVDLARLIADEPSLAKEIWNDCVSLIDGRILQPTIGHQWDFKDFKKAYQSLQNRSNIGKVVINVTGQFQKSAPKNNNAQHAGNRVAIVGMSGQFGAANDLNQLWEVLKSGKGLIEEVPADRWDVHEYFAPGQKASGKTYSKWGSFLRDIDKFDPTFFKISGAEAEVMDPQQRLFLEHCWKAMEDAAIAPGDLNMRKCSVFVGAAQGDYLSDSDVVDEASAFWGNSSSVLASRISYILNLKGPAVAIDTACSSSLVALDMGYRSLLNRESDIVLTGGVSIFLTPDFYKKTSRAGMLSPTGICHAFDNRANGFVPGEGVGVLIMKRLEDAMRDGDHIYGVVAGSLTNQDGTTNGITAPSASSQTNLEKELYSKFDINPETITYVEAHGTGTSLGDPIEFEALTNSFASFTTRKQFCALGSVKSNIGHTVMAAGVAGVIKVLLCLKHRQLPPSISYEQPNPLLDLPNSPFKILNRLEDWRTEGIAPRRAAVSSFGFSGTNAHVVIEEYRSEPPKNVPPATAQVIVILSAKDRERLVVHAENLLTHLQTAAVQNISELAYTLQIGRESMDERLAVLAGTVPELINILEDYLKGNTSRVLTGHVVQAGLRNNEEVDLAIREQNLRALGKLWVSGQNINWSLLYQTQRPAKISLPTYPFARHRYWKEDKTSSELKTHHTCLHPLVHANVSDLSGQKFQSVFTGEEVFLKHHVVRNTVMLPAVAYLEIAREACLRSVRKKLTQIKNMKFLHPLSGFESSQTVDIIIQQLNGSLRCEVASNQMQDRQLHCVAEISTDGVPTNQRYELQQIRQRCINRASENEFYKEFTQRGLQLGSTYNTVQGVQYNATEALASIRAHKGQGIERLLGLMDGMLQTFVAIGMDDQRRPIGLPYSMGQVNFYDSLDTDREITLWAYARRKSLDVNNIPVFDIDLMDESGKVFLNIVDFIVLPVPESVGDTTSLHPHAGLSLFKRQWISKVPTATRAESEHLILIASASFSLVDRLKEMLTSEVLPIIGNSEGEYFEYVLGQIKNRIKSNYAVHITVVVSEADFHDYAFLSGLLKTAHLENSCITGKVLCLENISDNNLEELVEILTVEQYTIEPEVRYTNGKREVRVAVEISHNSDAPNAAYLTKGSAYIITGGLGGLGRIFSKHFADVLDVQLVLVGKSALDSERESFLKTLPLATYHQCDIADPDQCKALVEAIKSKGWTLKGIIHSAGVINDSFILKKEKEQFSEVLNTKILGAQNLDRATRDEKLDFVVFFSSISAVTGNIAQGDYASANAYLGDYAAFRNRLMEKGERTGHTMCISWPLWQTGGMQMSAENMMHLEKNFKMYPMPADIGIAAFEKLMNHRVTEAVVGYGSSSTLLEVLNNDNSKNIPASESPQWQQSDAQKHALQNDIEQQLSEMALAILKLRPAEISVHKEFGTFGFDSIMFTKFASNINIYYGLDLVPTIFYNYPTIERLAGNLIQHHYPAVIARHQNHETYNKKMNGQSGKISANNSLEMNISTIENEANKDGLAKQYYPEPIAVIGLSCRFPGSANADAFWKNIRENFDLVTEIPETRWNWREYYGDPQLDAGKTKVKWGGFIDDIDKFDAGFFSLSPREAVLMDPQHRIALEAVCLALDDAGVPRKKIQGTKTGVFIGVSTSDYSILLRKNPEYTKQALFTTGSAHSTLVNRISYLLDLHGPSEPIDTACSSSLIAIHRSVESLRNGSCELAIAGGVNTLLAPETTLSFSNAGMLSEDGRCKSFDQGANGYVRGEGVGIVILKTLNKAQQDGDHIYAVIRGSAENHGGKANTFTSPNPLAQKDLLVEAYNRSNTDPRNVSFIEAHGTGTPLGDPVETEGLKLAFNELYQRVGATVSEQHCGIGTVKANIGHLEAAAGIAGVIKVILSLKNQILPGNPQLRTPNKYLKLDNTPFYLQKETKPWQPAEGTSRIAGVSSFGFGGANAHVILEEYITKEKALYPEGTPLVFILSAKNRARLAEYVERLYSFIKSNPEANLHNVAYTLQTGRDAMEERLAFEVSNREELLNCLSEFLAGETERLFTGTVGQGKQNFLLEGNAGKTYIQSAIANKEHKALAQLWGQGNDLDWSLLYTDHKPQKISLPGYPFAREIHWFDQVPGKRFSMDQSAKEQHQVSSARADKAQTEEMSPRPLVIKGQQNFVDLNDDQNIGEEVNEAVGDNRMPMSGSEIKTIIVKLLADTLYTEPEKIDLKAKFVDMGLDSIISVELVKNINQHFGLSLSTTELYNYSNIPDLTDFLSKELKSHPSSLSATKANTPKVTIRTTVHEESKAQSIDRTVNPKILSQHLPTYNKNTREETDIAIVGMSGIFPQSESLEIFWDHLKSGRNLVTEVPPQRWDVNAFYNPDPKVKGKTYSKWMGAITNVDKFDPQFFSISPKEAELMDPQQRLFLEQSWKALEDAGYNPKKLSNKRCGVFVGVSQGDYNSDNLSAENLTAYTLMGNSCSILSARISYFLNLKGPCITVDTSCSSALVAIAQACDSLVNGNSEIALAGGVCVLTTPRLHILTSKANMLSADGKCKAFDQDANGFVPGEGVGILVLKKLEQAKLDNDLIYGVIKGWGVNQDGSTNGITAPSDLSQSSLQRGVYDRFGIDPSTISYVEAHGTGTKLGDPIEVKALNNSFKAYSDKVSYCGLGSVKTNIGHTLTAAGVASVIKVLLSIKHRQIPPSINFSKVNEHLDLDKSPFYINTSLKEWTTEPGTLRRAAVSSFGFSGTNAHLVIDEYSNHKLPYRNDDAAIVVLSAKNTDRLQAQARELKDYLTRHPHEQLHSVAYTLQIGREPMEERMALIADSLTTAISRLDEYLQGNTDDVLIGNVRKIKQDGWPDDQRQQQHVRQAVAAKDAESLAQLWVNGINVDWDLLYTDGNPGKVRLPGYSFAAESYWFDSYPEQPSSHKKTVSSTTSVKPSLWDSDSLLQSVKHKVGNELNTEVTEEGIAIVKMSDRKSNNTLTPTLILSLQKTFLELRKNKALKAVVLTGFDNVFCMGGSQDALLDIADKKRRFSDVPFLYRGMLEFDVPVIAAIQGHAFGGGLLFGLYADIVVLSEESTYSANFMTYGFTPGMGATFILGEKFGKQLATEMMYTAKLISGVAIKERGGSVIVTKDVLKSALQIARELSSKPRKALQALKANLSERILNDLQHFIDKEVAMHEETFHTVGVKESISEQFRKHATQSNEVTLLQRDEKPIISSKIALAALEQDESDYQKTETSQQQFINVRKSLSNTISLEALPEKGTAATVVTDDAKEIEITQRLKKIFEEILHIPVNELDEDATFTDVGVDSISGVEIIRQVNEVFAIGLEAVVLYDYHTIKKLSSLIYRESNWVAGQRSSIPVQASVKNVDQEIIVHVDKEIIVKQPSNQLSLDPLPLTVAASPPVSEQHVGQYDVAVIGMSGQFPGAHDIDMFWKNLIEGKNCVREVPLRKWDVQMHYHPDQGAPGKSYGKWMGYIEDEDKFDALFFNISPREAERMDPQQRLFLQECWKALEDAGYASTALSGSSCGVFVGAGQGDYIRHFKEGDLDSQVFTGISTSILASRISYYLNLKGPAVSVDTACSSSLVAIHQACQSILQGESTMALAGGVYILTSEQMHVMTSAAGMLSADGICKPFDQNANGFVPGEGVGVIVLKRLEDAQRDGDRIYGIVKASGMNQDGKTNGITAPSAESQAALETEVYRKGRLNPENISYVEAHGTGTKLGDPIEVRALKDAFRLAGTDKRNYCALGSVKGNIGHTLSAAGVASVIKVLLSMRHKKLPPSINFHQLNEHIKLDDSPFYVNKTLQDWTPQPGIRRISAVSSFGFSGTNAHVVLEEYHPIGKSVFTRNIDPVIVLSAKNKERLYEVVKRLREFIIANPLNSVDSVAYTLQVGRDAMEERVAMVVTDLDQLCDRLTDYLAGSFFGMETNNIKTQSVRLKSDGTNRQVEVENAINNRDSKALAALWVSGATIDWKLLYRRGKPDKLSLPAYPFEKKRYWVPGLPNNPLVVSQKLHPLLHANESDTDRQKYTSTYTGHEFFLAEHRVMDEKILPGVAYLELAREAGERTTNERVTQFKDVVWLAPFRVNGKPEKVHITLQRSGEDVTFEIYSQKQGHNTVHSNGRLVAKPHSLPAKFDLAAIRNRLRESKEKSECYSLIRQRGLNLGSSFQGIEKIFYSADEALSMIRLPKSDGFVLAPGVLDSALQTCIGLSFGRNVHTLALPYSVKEVTVYKELPEVAWSYARKSNQHDENKSVISCDVDLLNSDGEVILSFKDFLILPLTGEIKNNHRHTQTSSSVNAKDVQRFLYAPVFKRMNIAMPYQVNTGGKHVIVTGNASLKWVEKVTQTISKLGSEVLEVRDLANVPDDIAHIYLLQALAPHQENTWHDAIQSVELSVFNGVKALADKYAHRPLNVTALTNSTQKILTTDAVSEIGGGVPGFLGCIAQEQFHWNVRIIDLSTQCIEDDISPLFTLPFDKETPLLGYRNGKFYDRKLTPLTLPVKQVSKFRQGGVYVILGGAGGLGKVTTKHLVQNYGAQVVWLGRSSYNESIRASQQEIEALGVKPHYVQCDATDRLSVENAFQKISAIYPGIHGLFHSAIVLNDKLLTNMDEMDFKRAFYPKAVGSQHLVEVFGKRSLDFVCFYSSVQSFINVHGQCNYSAGCTYKDSYAHGLQQKINIPTFIINWGYWGDVGIVSSPEYRKRTEFMGVGSITPEEGMEILELILANNQTQVAAIKFIKK